MDEPKAIDVIIDDDYKTKCYMKADADKALSVKDKEIEELKQKLEDAGMRERRLKRALYKACVNWAHFAVAFFSSYVVKNRWRWMELKCLKKSREYK